MTEPGFIEWINTEDGEKAIAAAYHRAYEDMEESMSRCRELRYGSKGREEATTEALAEFGSAINMYVDDHFQMRDL